MATINFKMLLTNNIEKRGNKNILTITIVIITEIIKLEIQKIILPTPTKKDEIFFDNSFKSNSMYLNFIIFFCFDELFISYRHILNYTISSILNANY